MIILMYILILVGLFINLDVPNKLTNVSWYFPLLEGILTVIIGQLLISHLLKRYPSKSRKKFLVCFLGSFAISLLYMNVIWIPYIDANYAIQAFDPIRYYYGANEMARLGETDAYMNYFGVVYFYAFFMKILGVHPLVPLFINILMSLYATIEITKLFHGTKRNITKNFPFLMLIPEVMCFNAYSSREIICMACLTIILVKTATIMKRFKVSEMIIGILSLFLIFLIRPPFGMLAILCIAVCSLFYSKSKKLSIAIAVIIVGTVVLSTQVSTNMGDSTDSLDKQLDTSRKVDATDGNTYSSNSFSKMLLPSNSIEFVIFGIVRSFAYIMINPSNLVDPYDSFVFSKSPTGICANWTSLLMMLCIPTLYKGIKAYKYQEDRFKLICLSLVICFLVIGIFMASFIHIRYRIIYDLMYFAIAFYIMADCKTIKTIKR